MPDPLRTEPTPSKAINIVRQWDDDQLHVPDRDDVLPWELGLERLDATELYWNVSQGSDGSPHVRPVFAVVCDGVLCSTSSSTARKTALMRQAPCTLATSTEGMDVIYEGVARQVDDADRLARIADGYRTKYGWPVEVTPDGAFHAPFGAPAAGPPPYLVFAIEPVTVRGLGTDERYAARSTRWEFDR
ncbi:MULTISPECIES: pyridoxamine 5'-phosphate oxidase family protein [unclassified Nocardia]|uniref:pyridoxamine 5'-phosphate oxidase family protein n=1 Tax=unclassified Nocardia TaxID=2637762 RepID=UPI0024A7FAA0|nr:MULTISPECIES: pyridoxamine 5'-phosphate oxidase family protein [unclassified Nocardia]